MAACAGRWPTEAARWRNCKSKTNSKFCWQPPRFAAMLSHMEITPTPKRICPTCGNSFMPRAVNGVYCTRRCRARAARKKEAEVERRVAAERLVGL